MKKLFLALIVLGFVFLFANNGEAGSPFGPDIFHPQMPKNQELERQQQQGRENQRQWDLQRERNFQREQEYQWQLQEMDRQQRR